jgi:hypothetical protein
LPEPDAVAVIVPELRIALVSVPPIPRPTPPPAEKPTAPAVAKFWPLPFSLATTEAVIVPALVMFPVKFPPRATTCVALTGLEPPFADTKRPKTLVEAEVTPLFAGAVTVVSPAALTMMLPEFVMLPLMLPPPAAVMLALATPPEAVAISPVAEAFDRAAETAVAVSAAMWERLAVMVPALVMPPLKTPPPALAPTMVTEPPPAVTERPFALLAALAKPRPETEKALVTASVAPIVAVLVIVEVICPPVGELEPPLAVIASPLTATVGRKMPTPVKDSSAVPWERIIPPLSIAPVKTPPVTRFSPLAWSPGLTALPGRVPVALMDPVLVIPPETVPPEIRMPAAV